MSEKRSENVEAKALDSADKDKDKTYKQETCMNPAPQVQASYKNVTFNGPATFVITGNDVDVLQNSVMEAQNTLAGLNLKEDLTKITERYLNSNDQKFLTNDLNLGDGEIPEVYPRMIKVDFYKGKEPNPKERFEPSTNHRDLETSKSDQTIDFANLLSLIKESRFLTLLGPPGSGKTTLSQKLAKFLTSQGRFVILLKFMDIGYDNRLTLRQLLIDHPFNDLEKSNCANVFTWIKNNQEECTFVLDGFDQFTSLKGVNPLNASYDTALSVQQIVANLCSKKFLPKSSLVFTSRPHPMLLLSTPLRPDVTVYVHDLSTEDMKRLFCVYAGSKSEELWEMLSTKAPQLIALCHNPLILQFIVYVGLHGGVSQIRTITKVLEAILALLQYSEFAKAPGIDTLKKPLGSMAYKGMLRKSVVFTTDDLRREGLEDVKVQDFVIKSRRYSLFEGDAVFTFIHQIFQEVFAAIYLYMFMSTEEFNKVVHEVIFEGHWSMVRRFLCGFLLGDKMVEGKCETFYKELVDFIQSFDYIEQLIDLLVDLEECSDEVKNSLAKYFPPEYHLTLVPMSPLTAYALGQLLPRLTSPVEVLDLRRCNLNFTMAKWIFNGIIASKHKVEIVYLSHNNIGDEGVKYICDCLPKVNKWYLHGCAISKAKIEVIADKVEKLGISRSAIEGLWIE